MKPDHQPMVVLVRPRVQSQLTDPNERFRTLTEELAILFPYIHVVCVPFLYDATAQSPVAAEIRQRLRPRLVLSTLSSRAAQWLLDEMEVETVPELDSFCQVELFSIESLKSVVENFLKTTVVNEEIETLTGSRVSPTYIEESPMPRWYPIIDRDACLGCLECVNFCLFGVYSIDAQSRPVVESPDACRDGCPACSRICPGGAIMFPLHAEAAISGQLDAKTVARQIHEQDTARRAREIRSDYLDRAAGYETTQTTDELDRLINETDQFQE